MIKWYNYMMTPKRAIGKRKGAIKMQKKDDEERLLSKSK